jgi:hypothetical protein
VLENVKMQMDALVVEIRLLNLGHGRIESSLNEVRRDISEMPDALARSFPQQDLLGQVAFDHEAALRAVEQRYESQLALLRGETEESADVVESQVEKKRAVLYKLVPKYLLY